MSSKQRRRPLIAAAALLLLPLTGCTWANQTEAEQSPSQQTAGQAALSNLTEAEQLRDRVARSEAAVQRSAELLANLASECDSCMEALKYAADTSGERLGVVGGLWEPWSEVDVGAQSNLPQPPEVGDAPVTPASLAGYMQATAVEQLDGLQRTHGIDAPDRLLLSSVLTGRLLGARYLAASFTVDVAAAAAQLPPGATATSPTEIPTEDTAILPSVEDQVPGDGDTGAALLLSVTQSYDCIGSSLGLSILPSENYSITQDLYDRLLARRVILAANTSAETEAAARCVLDFPDADSLLNELLAADLELFTSPEANLSEAGLEWLLEDVDTVAKIGGLSALTPGLRLGATPEEG